jgi:hypothetical protein
VNRIRLAASVAATASTVLLAALALTTPAASGAFTARVRNAANAVTTAQYFHCADALAQDAATALFQWPLSDAADVSTAADISGQNHPGSYQGTRRITTTAPLACPRDTGSAWQPDGSAMSVYSSVQQANPTTFTVEIWFRTSVAGGKLIGFGTGAGSSGQYDRHLYIDKNGAVVFGVYANAIRTVRTTAGSYADGAWHLAAGTLSSQGLSLYVDGELVTTDATVTTAENDTGYWKVGYDTLGGSWPNVSTAYFTGSLRYAAVYTSALAAAQIRAHFAAGR